MPYIKKDERARLSKYIDELGSEINRQCTPGELNYIITNICLHYLSSRGKNYTHINDIIGVLQSTMLEFYRRSAEPYENEKIKENGDVY